VTLRSISPLAGETSANVPNGKDDPAGEVQAGWQQAQASRRPRRENYIHCQRANPAGKRLAMLGNKLWFQAVATLPESPPPSSIRQARDRRGNDQNPGNMKASPYRVRPPGHPNGLQADTGRMASSSGRSVSMSADAHAADLAGHRATPTKAW